MTTNYQSDFEKARMFLEETETLTGFTLDNVGDALEKMREQNASRHGKTVEQYQKILSDLLDTAKDLPLALLNPRGLVARGNAYLVVGSFSQAVKTFYQALHAIEELPNKDNDLNLLPALMGCTVAKLLEAAEY